MRVEITDDLEQAKIFVSVFPDEKEKNILKLLDDLKPELVYYIRKQIKSFLPDIFFEIDKSIKLERKIEEALKNNGHVAPATRDPAKLDK